MPSPPGRASPRKQPRQERSRATVEAILEAAIRILERGRLASLTTTRVAELAGVSVGSLYQYFPARDAILGELVRRQRREAVEAVRAAVDASRERPLAERLHAGISALVALKRRRPRLHRALSIESARLDGVTRKRRAVPRLAQLLRTLAREHPLELGARPGRTATAAAVHAVEGVLARALEDPALLGSGDLERVLTRLALAALRAD